MGKFFVQDTAGSPKHASGTILPTWVTVQDMVMLPTQGASHIIIGAIFQLRMVWTDSNNFETLADHVVAIFFNQSPVIGYRVHIISTLTLRWKSAWIPLHPNDKIMLQQLKQTCKTHEYLQRLKWIMCT